MNKVYTIITFQSIDFGKPCSYHIVTNFVLRYK